MNWTDQAGDTTQKSGAHIFKIKPQTPFVEKIVNFHEFT